MNGVALVTFRRLAAMAAVSRGSVPGQGRRNVPDSRGQERQGTQRRNMQTAVIMGLLASSAFPIGVAIGLFFRIPRRLLASIVGFGAGALVVALTSELMKEAVDEGFVVWVVAGLFPGCMIYVSLDFSWGNSRSNPRPAPPAAWRYSAPPAR